MYVSERRAWCGAACGVATGVLLLIASIKLDAALGLAALRSEESGSSWTFYGIAEAGLILALSIWAGRAVGYRHWIASPSASSFLTLAAWTAFFVVMWLATGVLQFAFAGKRQAGFVIFALVAHIATAVFVGGTIYAARSALASKLKKPDA
jgi:hypothetical protein